ncbi:uncharacterized protein EAF01_001113 [Botrytis porri]|uniref:Mitochondrial division protein 1 n=1 Tax=Botrytis porri TaxID=87229 RepID=A0A4Z1K426_9HELO|nr:uncharacterized protein EAF01_001113 [Botrytis porri]KAF7912092.1 hypothetical protein EAF01_001113 [Botrytis porri]TGO80861.1 hypothetical protein BPOR_1610g00010 [Botrytis porri]
MLQTLEGHTNSISSVAFSPNSKQIISGSSDNTLQIWDIATGEQSLSRLIASSTSLGYSKRRADSSNEGHTSEVYSVAFLSDGKQIISGSYDNTMRVWDITIGEQILPTLKGYISEVSSIAFSLDGIQVVSESDNLMLPHTLVLSNNWVIEGGVNILWLPSEYCIMVVAIYRGFVVLEQSSRRISFFEFAHTSKFP